MTSSQFLIYGATGYTAGLIIKEAKGRGLSPILAGRNHEKLMALGSKWQLPTRVFSLDDPEEIIRQIHDVDDLLNCAGPFSETALPLLQACIKTRTHYLDITGEIAVFESIYERDQAIKDANICAIPGVGFDVVPTDCLAAHLKGKLPDATHLSLAFASEGNPYISHGTAKTMISHLHKGGMVRHEGKIKKVPLAYKKRKIPFASGEKLCATIPWGDVASAFRTTGIPSIEVYTQTTPQQWRSMQWGKLLLPLLHMKPLRDKLSQMAGAKAAKNAPAAESKGAQTVQLWGEVRNARGDIKTATLSTPEGYRFSALAALAALEALPRVTARGALTPALAFSEQFVKEIPGVTGM